jgi:predicted RNA-binding protein YlqC (UPF0109 family)
VKELVEYIAKSLVDDPSQVDVEVVEDDNKFTVVKLNVAPDDTGRVIGRQGRVADAIRTLLRAVATTEGKRVTLKIED